MGIACDRYGVTIYRYMIVLYKSKNSRGTTREIFQGFYTTDIAHYNIFLGRDWLVQIEPNIK